MEKLGSELEKIKKSKNKENLERNRLSEKWIISLYYIFRIFFLKFYNVKMVVRKTKLWTSESI